MRWPWKKREAEKTEDGFIPREIDPNNPPKYMKYSPRDARKAPPRCSTCPRTLEVGERVLLWPIPDTAAVRGAYDLYCERCYKKAK